MKPYGIKHEMKGPCACEMCYSHNSGKQAIKRRERNKAKKDIKNELQDFNGKRKK
jgi:hypothetical protein